MTSGYILHWKVDIVGILTNEDLDQFLNLDAPFRVSQSQPISSADPALIVGLVFCRDNPLLGKQRTGKLISSHPISSLNTEKYQMTANIFYYNSTVHSSTSCWIDCDKNVTTTFIIWLFYFWKAQHWKLLRLFLAFLVIIWSLIENWINKLLVDKEMK